MINVRSGLRILVASRPVDFRRGIDSLCDVGERDASQRPLLRRSLHLPAETGGSHQNPDVGWDGSYFVFEALGERPFHMATDLRWIDYAERHTTFTFAGRLGLEKGPAAHCGPAIAGGLNVWPFMPVPSNLYA